MYNNDTFRGSICYILYNSTGVCDVSPVFDFSEIDILYWLKRSNTLLNTRNMMWKNNNTRDVNNCSINIVFIGILS